MKRHGKDTALLLHADARMRKIIIALIARFIFQKYHYSYYYLYCLVVEIILTK